MNCLQINISFRGIQSHHLLCSPEFYIRFQVYVLLRFCYALIRLMYANQNHICRSMHMLLYFSVSWSPTMAHSLSSSLALSYFSLLLCPEKNSCALWDNPLYYKTIKRIIQFDMPAGRGFTISVCQSGIHAPFHAVMPVT